MKKICVLGLGYIGLPTALLLAQNNEVLGVDINDSVVSNINKGILPFSELGLSDLFETAQNNFYADTSIKEADVFVICVPTPLDDALKMSELKYIRSAALMISSVIKKGNLVILESTVPPGTSEKIIIPILESSGVPYKSFKYAHCPERAIPSNTLHEMVFNDRIIGADDDESAKYSEKVYSSFVKGQIFHTTIRTAEFVKLMENTHRDVNIALANEFALLANEVGISVWDCIKLANKHPRVNVLNPGPGVGGHCIAVDPWFLTENVANANMILLSRRINEFMPNHVIATLRDMLKNIQEPKITILGVSYKANVDDWRETPAIKIIRLAENEGFDVQIHDPHVNNFPYPLKSLEDATKGSDCLILVTDHELFKKIDPTKLQLRNKNLFDTRNFLNHEMYRNENFNVTILGNENKLNFNISR